jgi:hypothetical protein
VVQQQQQANASTTTSYSSSSFGGFSALEKELHDLQTHLRVQT